MMRWLIATISNRGFGLGLLLSAFGFGFRHGIDWDHIAALTDIASSQETPRKGLYFGTIYAFGHAVVVFIIGTIAVVAGQKLPDSVDETMGKVVGITLILLGIYVLYALIRYRKDFRMRSRWMLLFAAIRRGAFWIRERFAHRAEDVEHEHEHGAADAFIHHDAAEENEDDHVHPEPIALKTTTHSHGHKHRMPSDPFMNYGVWTSLFVGMLHGVGAETPTQVLIFLAAAGSGGVAAGLTVLVVFLVGLFIANTVISLSASFGFLAAGKQFTVYATVSVLTGVVSLVIGSLFLFGKDTFLPAFFGG
ncbi:MAG: hypothetical protein ABR548_04985 [Actinomycetota bacterium]|nr:hypothetical protein [Actinomycetota bacterium]